MGALDVVREAEKRGGKERREALERVFIHARDLGCELRLSGGRAGGFNVRYGSIGYAVLDMDTRGRVKLYASMHPDKSPPDEVWEDINEFIDDRKGLEPKNHPINSYGQLEDPIEEIPPEALEEFLEKSVGLIRATYYQPHIDFWTKEIDSDG